MKRSEEKMKKCGKKYLSTLCFLTKFLYTNEINEIAMKNKFLKNYFLGVYPADIIPEHIKCPSCWIWNTDEQNENGKHSIAIWLTEKNIYFFDSFAKSVIFYSRQYWKDLAENLNVKFINVQTRGLQSKTTFTCGSWCLLYLYNKSTNEWKIANVKFKRKLNNDIQLKGLIINKYDDKIKSIYKQKCKKRDKKCCNFIEGFL